MKKLPLILSVIALAGVVALFILYFSANSSKTEDRITKPAYSSDGGGLKVAYVQTDSVLINYQLALDLNDDFIAKQTQYTEDFAKKRSNLEQQAVAFQEKLQRGGFLTEDRAMKERDRILGEEQEMQQLDYELSNKLAQMEREINIQIIDSIVGYVKEYNKMYNYDYIFSNNGNIIVGAEQFNITKDIIEGLNTRYSKSVK